MDGHYDDRPYKCILCLKVFKKPDKLKRHLKCAVHRETEPEVMEEALEACKKQHDDYQNKKKLEEGQGNNANGTTIKTEGKEQREQPRVREFREFGTASLRGITVSLHHTRILSKQLRKSHKHTMILKTISKVR